MASLTRSFEGVSLRLEMAAATGWTESGRRLATRSMPAVAYRPGNCTGGVSSRTRGVMNALSDFSGRGKVESVPVYGGPGGALARTCGLRAQARGRLGGSTSGSRGDARGGDASRTGGAGSTAGGAGSAGGAGTPGQGSGTAGGGAGTTSGAGTMGGMGTSGGGFGRTSGAGMTEGIEKTGAGAGTTSGAGTTGGLGTPGAGMGTTGTTSGTDVATRGVGERGLTRPGQFGGLTGLLDLWTSPVTSVWQMMDLIGRLTDQIGSGTRLPLEWRERDDKFLLRMDMPGVRKDEVKVRVEGEKTLVVSAEHRADEAEQGKDKEDKGKEELGKEDKGKNRIDSDARYLSRISLPDNVKANDIRADYKDGVLHVVIPKEKAAERKVVDVSIS